MKKLLLAAGAVLAVPVLLIAVLSILLHLPPVERWAGRQLAALLSAPGQQVAVEGFALRWPFDPRIAALHIADREGVWFDAGGLSVDWRPGALLRGRLAFDGVAAQEVHVLRRPLPEPEQAPPPSGKFAWPRLPLGLDLRRLDVNILLDRAVLGEPASLTLTGRAKATAAEGMLALDLQRTDGVDANAAVNLTFQPDGDRLALEAILREPAGGLVARLAGLPGLPPVAANLSGSGPLADWHGGLVVKQGRQSCIDSRIDSERDAETGDIAALVTGSASPACFGTAGLDSLSPLDVRLRLTGFAQGLPAADLVLATGQGSAGGATWQGQQAHIIAQPQQDGRWLVGASGHIDRLSAPANLAAVDWSLTGDVEPVGGMVRLGQMAVTVPGLSATAYGQLDRWGEAARLHVTARAPVPGAQGWAEARAELAGDLLAPRLDLAVTGRTGGLSTGIAQLDAVIGPDARLRAKGRVGADGLVHLREARLTGKAARAEVWGEAGTRLNLLVHGALPDLAALPGAPVTGGARLAARLTGPADAPRADGVADIDGKLRGEPLAGRIAFALHDPKSGRVHADLRSGALHADARTDFALEEALKLTDLTLHSGNSQVGGALTLSLDSMLATGRLQGRVADLAPWSKLAGMDLAGAVTLDARLSSQKGQNVAFDLRGRGLDLAGTRVGGATLSGDLADIFAAPRGRAVLQAQDVQQAGIVLDSLRAEVNGDGKSLAFTARADGKAEADRLTAQAAGRADIAGPRRRIALDSLTVRRGRVAAQLAQPTAVVLAPDATILERMLVTLGADKDGSGRIELAGRLTGGRLDGQARIEDLPLALAEAIRPGQTLAGTIGGQGSISGSLSDPHAEVSLTGRGLGFAAARNAGMARIDARLDARLAGGRVSFDGQARDAERMTASVTGEGPLDLSGGPPLPPGAPIRAAIQVRGDVGRIADALPLAGHRFAGNVVADISVGGTVADPLVGGQAEVSRGRYENYDSGTIIQNIQMKMLARDSRSFAVTGSGTDGGRGAVTLSGLIQAGEAGLTYQADGQVADFLVMRQDRLHAAASGTLHLEGDQQAAVLSGAMTVERADLNIEQQGSASIPKLEVVEINRPGQKRAAALVRPAAARSEAIEPPLEVGLKLEVTINQAFVRGRGLDSVWGGTLTVGGSLSRPTLVGQLTAQRGTFDFAGRSFRLTNDSKVTFDGNATIDPQLAITAEAKAQDLTARVNIGGRASKPEITFSSDPSYPSDEILARLLFGRGIGQLSTVQQLQLAQAVASLATGGGGFDPIGKIRSTLGLDVLEVGGGDARQGTGPSVAAGKYLDENTYLRVEQGTAGNSNVSVEVDLGRGLSVEGQAGQKSGTAGGGLGLNWRMDY